MDTIRGMSLDTPTHPGTFDHRLADALDRVAGALEQHARGLDELKADVRALVGGLRQVEARLDAIERVVAPSAAAATPSPTKGAGKKRAK